MRALHDFVQVLQIDLEPDLLKVIFASGLLELREVIQLLQFFDFFDLFCGLLPAADTVDNTMCELAHAEFSADFLFGLLFLNSRKQQRGVLVLRVRLRIVGRRRRSTNSAPATATFLPLSRLSLEGGGG